MICNGFLRKLQNKFIKTSFVTFKLQISFQITYLNYLHSIITYYNSHLTFILSHNTYFGLYTSILHPLISKHTIQSFYQESSEFKHPKKKENSLTFFEISLLKLTLSFHRKRNVYANAPSHTHTFMHACMHTHAHARTHMHAYKHRHTRTHAHIDTHERAYTHMHAPTHPSVHTHTQTHTRACTCKHAYTQAHAHTCPYTHSH